MLKPILAHTSDWHLRSSQYGRSYRGNDFLIAAKQVIDQVHTLGLQNMVHSGDILDAKNPASQAVDQLLEADRYLKERKIRMYTISGNHEFSEPSWIEIINKYATPGEGGIIPIDDKIVSIGNHRVAGFGACSPEALRQKLAGMNFPNANGDFLRADIIVWHGFCREFIDFPSAADMMEANEFLAPYPRAVLLGDIHKAQYYRLGDNGLIGYPGSTEYCEKGESAQKFFTVLYGDDEHAIGYTAQQMPITTRPVVFLNIGDEQALTGALIQLEAIQASAPIVFANFNPSLNGVVSRLRTVLHPDSVFRPAALPLIHMPGVAPVTQAQIENKGTEAFLGNFIPAGKERLYETGRSLLNRETKVVATLEEFINKRLEELTGEPTQA